MFLPLLFPLQICLNYSTVCEQVIPAGKMANYIRVTKFRAAAELRVKIDPKSSVCAKSG